MSRQQLYEWMLDNASNYIDDYGLDEDELFAAALVEMGHDPDDAPDDVIEYVQEVLNSVVEGYY